MKNYRAILFGLVVLLPVGTAVGQSTNLPFIIIAKERYEECVIERANAAQARIRHKSGIAYIPLQNLPKDLQLSLGYDPAKAGQWLQQEAKNRQIAAETEKARMARYAEQQRHETARLEDGKLIAEKRKSAIQVLGEFVENIDGGPIIRTQRAHASTTPTASFSGVGMYGSKTTYYEEKLAYVVGLPVGTVPDKYGLICFIGYTDGTYKYQDKEIPRWVWVSPYVPPKEQPDAFGRLKQRDPNIRKLGEHP